MRVDGGHIAITRSGADKGALTPQDVLLLDLNAPAHPQASAEAPLHVALYRASQRVGAVFHVHSPAAVMASRRAAEVGLVRLEGWELLKAFDGVDTHEIAVEVPVFANDQNVLALSQRILAALAPRPADGVRAPGYLLAGHGLYAWGADPPQAWRHLEALETLLAQHAAFYGERR